MRKLETPAAGDRLYSIAEVAAMWGVSRDTVERHVKHGELKSLQLGPRRRRIPAAELERFLAARVS